MIEEQLEPGHGWIWKRALPGYGNHLPIHPFDASLIFEIWKPPTHPSHVDMETMHLSIPCGYGNHLSIPCGYGNPAPIHLDRWDASLADKESAAYNFALHLSTLEDGKHLTKVDIDSTCYTWPVIHFCFFSNLISEHSSKAKIRVKFSFPVFRLGMTLVAVHTCFYCFTAPYLYLELFGWGEGPFYWALAT